MNSLTNNLLIIIVILFGFNTAKAQVAIGISSPDASAALDVHSSTKGFLPPRLSENDRDAMANLSVGLMIYNTDANCLQWWNGHYWYDGCDHTANLINEYPEGTVFCDPNPTEIVEVTSAESGNTWMDRNLGASQAANASNDSDAYGDLYQWGRSADGHQCRTSNDIDGDVASNRPDDGTDTGAWDALFITRIDPDGNWLTNSNTTFNRELWEGVNAINNPCPIGFRLPTQAEFQSERDGWGTAGNSNAINSNLKLPAAGGRHKDDAVIIQTGDNGYYWSSSTGPNQADRLQITDLQHNIGSMERAFGMSVRCFKD